MTWNKYHSQEDIYKWFDYLENKYDYCNIEIMKRKTFEGQDMKVMKVNMKLKATAYKSVNLT